MSLFARINSLSIWILKKLLFEKYVLGIFLADESGKHKT